LISTASVTTAKAGRISISLSCLSLINGVGKNQHRQLCRVQSPRLRARISRTRHRAFDTLEGSPIEDPSLSTTSSTSTTFSSSTTSGQASRACIIVPASRHAFTSAPTHPIKSYFFLFQ
jgi:hypothetical protein